MRMEQNEKLHVYCIRSFHALQRACNLLQVVFRAQWARPTLAPLLREVLTFWRGWISPYAFLLALISGFLKLWSCARLCDCAVQRCQRHRWRIILGLQQWGTAFTLSRSGVAYITRNAVINLDCTLSRVDSTWLKGNLSLSVRVSLPDRVCKYTQYIYTYLRKDGSTASD